jgi:prepilin-type processing-associated H-X9-DG protein
MKQHAKLTIVDAAVVVAIAVFLFFVSLPVSGLGRSHAKQVVCMTNVEGLVKAWLLYAEDNDGLLVGGSTYNSTDYRWCERPLRPGSPMPIPFGANPRNYEMPSYQIDQEARLRGIRAGHLFAYTGNESLYHCPGDDNLTSEYPQHRIFRSYAISGLMNAEDMRAYNQRITLSDGRDRKFLMAKKINQIVSPSMKYVFVEEEVVTTTVHFMMFYNLGSFVIFNANQPYKWWDVPADYHNNASALGFADGHVEIHEWKDPRTIASITSVPAPGQTELPPADQPGNEDLDFLGPGYFPCE